MVTFFPFHLIPCEASAGGLTRQQHGVLVQGLADVVGLARQRALVDLQVVALDQDAVGWQKVPWITKAARSQTPEVHAASSIIIILLFYNPSFKASSSIIIRITLKMGEFSYCTTTRPSKLFMLLHVVSEVLFCTTQRMHEQPSRFSSTPFGVGGSFGFRCFVNYNCSIMIAWFPAALGYTNPSLVLWTYIDTLFLNCFVLFWHDSVCYLWS